MLRVITGISIMYFLVILLVSWVFYTVMTNLDKAEGQ